jgi:hypothetical protein
MKRYKLLKDLPTFKAGGLFYISEYGALVYDDGGFGVMAYAQSTLEKFPNILTEWFEEIKEPTDSIHWKPKHGDEYFWIDECGSILPGTFYRDSLYDQQRLTFGNVYRTIEEAEKARERRLAEVRLQQTSNFKPNFEDSRGGWVVYYNYKDKELYSYDTDYDDSGETIRYATEEDSRKSIKENREDWLIYFGIKEKK